MARHDILHLDEFQGPAAQHLLTCKSTDRCIDHWKLCSTWSSLASRRRSSSSISAKNSFPKWNSRSFWHARSLWMHQTCFPKLMRCCNQLSLSIFCWIPPSRALPFSFATIVVWPQTCISLGILPLIFSRFLAASMSIEQGARLLVGYAAPLGQSPLFWPLWHDGNNNHATRPGKMCAQSVETNSNFVCLLVCLFLAWIRPRHKCEADSPKTMGNVKWRSFEKENNYYATVKENDLKLRIPKLAQRKTTVPFALLPN